MILGPQWANAAVVVDSLFQASPVNPLHFCLQEGLQQLDGEITKTSPEQSLVFEGEITKTSNPVGAVTPHVGRQLEMTIGVQYSAPMSSVVSADLAQSPPDHAVGDRLFLSIFRIFCRFSPEILLFLMLSLRLCGSVFQPPWC